MKLRLSPIDVVTAAVAADDREWFSIAFHEIYRAPKQEVADLLIDCFRHVVLEAGLQTPEDVELAISRLADIAGQVMSVPKNCGSIGEHNHQVSSLQRDAAERVCPEMQPVLSRLSLALKAKDRKATRALAQEIESRWKDDLLPPARESESDADLASAVFTAYADLYRAWFERAEWCGKRVSKSRAYLLIDSIAGAAPARVRKETVYPILRDLISSMTDPEVCDAVSCSLEEFEEIDRGKSG